MAFAVVSSILIHLRHITMNKDQLLQGTQAYFTIGQVAEAFAVATSVLRYWESQFPRLKPRKHNKRRMYTKADIALIARIHHLLYEQGLTIAGARKKMAAQDSNPGRTILLDIKRELVTLIHRLQNFGA